MPAVAADSVASCMLSSAKATRTENSNPVPTSLRTLVKKHAKWNLIGLISKMTRAAVAITSTVSNEMLESAMLINSLARYREAGCPSAPLPLVQSQVNNSWSTHGEASYLIVPLAFGLTQAIASKVECGPAPMTLKPEAACVAPPPDEQTIPYPNRLRKQWIECIPCDDHPPQIGTCSSIDCAPSTARYSLCCSTKAQ